MQTPGFQAEEKNTLNNNNNKPEADGQTMLKPISWFWKAVEPRDGQTQELWTTERRLVSPVAGQPQVPENPRGPWPARMGQGRQRMEQAAAGPRPNPLQAEFSSARHLRANARLGCKAPVLPHRLPCQAFNYTIQWLFSLTQCRAVSQGASFCFLTEGRKLPPRLEF